MDTGARTYIPAIGRFTSVDSVENGNANAYMYPADPVNQSDLSGKCIGPLIFLLPECIELASAALTAGIDYYETGETARIYGKFRPANIGGEMAGGRKVTQISLKNINKRSWYEILDHNGRIRSVRPFDGGAYRHYIFDKDGKYTGI